jgi:hypothetical protein
VIWTIRQQERVVLGTFRLVELVHWSYFSVYLPQGPHSFPARKGTSGRCGLERVHGWHSFDLPCCFSACLGLCQLVAVSLSCSPRILPGFACCLSRTHSWCEPACCSPVPCPLVGLWLSAATAIICIWLCTRLLARVLACLCLVSITYYVQRLCPYACQSACAWPASLPCLVTLFPFPKTTVGPWIYSVVQGCSPRRSSTLVDDPSACPVPRLLRPCTPPPALSRAIWRYALTLAVCEKASLHTY